jgi:predicted 2-oxoglutarate/Fe(II)-dependent dioxygenase YbiX/peroxiredoxin
VIEEKIQMSAVGLPSIGAVAPFFAGKTDVNEQFAFSAMAGRWVVLLFFGSLNDPAGRAADAAMRSSNLFDDARAAYFGVSSDPDDRRLRGLKSARRGRRYFYDDDGAIAGLYGVVQSGTVRPLAFLLDRALRVVSVVGAEHADALLASLGQHLHDEHGSESLNLAPVLTVPRIFEPEFCRELIAYHAETGGEASGIMRDVNGRTVGVLDSRRKIRRDRWVEDQELIQRARNKISARLRPAVFGAFNWMATRIERYMVACYSADDGGFFSAHRDNTSLATAHRQFAVTINLNDDFDGGELRFPEYGRRTYRPPVGGATVFNCSMLHEATPVTRGIRYAFVPFLYDETGAAIRKKNAGALLREPPTVIGAPAVQAAE